MQYQYNDIALSTVGDLNSRLLNMSFSKLIENDQSIIPINNYIPGIWENKWFNDNTIAGYSIGDIVWKYSMTSAEFLNAYHEHIYNYAVNNSMLNGYFRHNPSNYSYEIDRYENVISGYSVDEPILDDDGNRQFDTNNKVISQRVLYLLPLFDYGAYNSNDNQKIEIYISLINDNKELLSNSLAWTNITLRNINSFKEFISTEISLLFDNHIKKYHLGGISTNNDFSEILLKKDFSNFDISSLYNAQQMINHTQYINDLGFDYVRIFKKEDIKTNLKDNTMPMYRWCRLWNSGHLEHGGIIEIPKYDIISSSNASCYIISVDLDWANDDKLYYDYPMSKDFYGSQHNNLYFTNNAQIEKYELSTQLTINNRYVVTITPILFNDNDLTDYLLKLINEADLIKTSYPSNTNNDKNKTFINYEVHNMTNKYFCLTRSRTDDLTDTSKIRYILYYVSGYRSSIDLSYNITSCIINGIKDVYAYTGYQIKPDYFIVIANNGEILKENVHYIVRYGENIKKYGTIEIVGILPFFGTLTKRFDII